MEIAEKILLATQQIQLMANTIAREQQIAALRIEKDDKIYHGMVEQPLEVLNKNFDKIMDVVENLANYINMSDTICAEDVALSKVPMDILYGRMEEDDFENVTVEYVE